ncbi:hypothetical protein B7463_g4175, partial [Scytalidium lignicola]
MSSTPQPSSFSRGGPDGFSFLANAPHSAGASKQPTTRAALAIMAFYFVYTERAFTTALHDRRTGFIQVAGWWWWRPDFSTPPFLFLIPQQANATTPSIESSLLAAELSTPEKAARGSPDLQAPVHDEAFVAGLSTS